MFKSFIYGFLVGVLLTGIGWYFLGRNDIGEIRNALDGADRNLEGSELLVDQFGNDFDRYTRKISAATGQGEQLRDQIGELREEFGGYLPEFGGIKSELVAISDGVDGVEKSVRRIVQVNRDFADILYEYRRLGETSGATE